ncbi:ABC-2 transporter permease [Pseudobacteroides cellulosolvens]|uniref:ABC-2 membrane transporter-like protein n=1 Tax=Pseudobacteroides cellulosolvens ATCC 35603 = DSM 2933 TaxID=398512 RepID=A0A0L6JVR1_9FIRM|nr:ABC-2 transporter permease [Pseudobacteroides cellulosolvens]KNY29804.1 ABC-2 membrane transporter-like protein [Pseudobacteroides cellulosolvens ATCC 35603 = DSM 2933]
MMKAVNVVRIDILTVKPYMKLFLLLIAVGLLFGMGNKEPYVIPPMFMIWASFFVAYPFSIGEKNSLDRLYGTFALKRKDIVAGRYIFSLFSAILSMIFAILSVYVSSVFIKKDIEIEALLFVVCFGFLMFAAVISFQIPMYFKVGYTKARVLTYLPLMLIGFAAPMISLIPSDSTVGRLFSDIGKILEEKTYMAYAIFLGASIIVLYISYLISSRIYEKKDI